MRVAGLQRKVLGPIQRQLATGQAAWPLGSSAAHKSFASAAPGGQTLDIQRIADGWNGLPWYWLLAPIAGAAALAMSPQQAHQELGVPNPAKPLGRGARSCMGEEWVKKLASGSDTSLVLSASTMHDHPLLKNDHLFTKLLENGAVEDLCCFYSPSRKRLDYVIQFGSNVCGFPKIMHGGLTAAIVDEAFGFTWLSLRANKQLPFRGPAFTAHLEVNYKQKIPAGKMLLCTTELEECEGRKLWMKATVCDGASGKVYATAKALFVCPRKRKLIEEGVKYAYNHIFKAT